ncbi:MAG: hypothetical protein ACKO4S_01305 [Snowella sp.]
MLNIPETLTQQGLESHSFNYNNTVSPKIEGGNEQKYKFSPLTGEDGFKAFWNGVLLKAYGDFDSEYPKHFWPVFVISKEHRDFYRFPFTEDPIGLLTRLKDKDKPLSRETVRDLVPLYSTLRPRSEKEGDGITFIPSAPPFAPIGEKFNGSRLLWTEFDQIDSLEGQWQIIEFLRKHGLDPTAVVYSGGKSLHIFYLLDGSVNADDLRYLNGLFIPLGCDPSPAKNVVNQMRLPGFYRAEKGKEQTLEYLSDSVYSVASFTEGFESLYLEKGFKFETLEQSQERVKVENERLESQKINVSDYDQSDIKKALNEFFSKLTIPKYVSGNNTYTTRFNCAVALFWLGFSQEESFLLAPNLFEGVAIGWNTLERYPFNNPLGTLISQLRQLLGDNEIKFPQWFNDKYNKGDSKRISKFEDILASVQKFKERIKPKGFGKQKDKVTEFEGDRTQKWLDTINSGKDVLDGSTMGSGKSFSVPLLENPYGGKIWYLSSDPRNPSIPEITKKFTLLLPRNAYGFYQDEEGKLKKADVNTPQDLIVIEGNCPRADLFTLAINEGHDPNQDGKDNPICTTCQKNKICSFADGMYRHERFEALASSYIRCHPNSLPTPKTLDNPNGYDYSNDIFVVDEPTILIKPTKISKAKWNKIWAELDSLSERISPELWKELLGILQKVKPLFDNEERWGLDHNDILDSLKDVIVSDELINAISENPLDLSKYFVEIDSIDTPLGQEERKKYKGPIQLLKAQFWAKASEETKANLDSIPSNIILPLLFAMSGEQGIILRINRGHLIVTVDNRNGINQVLSATKGNIFLDATLCKEKLKTMTGNTREITAIKSKDFDLSHVIIQPITVQGIGSKDFSETAKKRVNLICEELEKKHGGKIPKLGHKKHKDDFNLDGYWFRDNRGSNDFVGFKQLLSIGLPRPNRGAIEDEYLSLMGNPEGFENYYQDLVCDEVVQWVGRPRAHKDKGEYIIYMLVPPDTDNPEKDIDLSFLSGFGFTVNTPKPSFEINQEAGTETQAVRYRLLNAIKQCVTNGIKLTQTAIARILNISQPAVSKMLSKAGVTLKDLEASIEGLLKKYNHPLDDPNRTGYIPYELYKDLAVFFDLPIEQIAADAVSHIVRDGWEAFKEYLELLPDTLQAIYLGILWSIHENNLSDDSSPDPG